MGVLLVAAGFSFLAFLQALVRLKEPERKQAAKAEGKQNAAQVVMGSRALQVLLLANFFANYNFQVIQTIGALMLDAYFGWGTGELGLILAGCGVTMALVQAVAMTRLLRVFGVVGTAAF